MRFGVLGPLAVWNDRGDAVTVPGLKVRALLAALLVDPGRPVSADRLVEHLWGDDLPGNPPGALSAKVSQLRRALEDAEPGARALVVSPPPGYLLRAGADAVDAGRFERLAAEAREAPGPEEKAELLSGALGLWRGPAFADVADEPFARAAVARLEELRLTALEDLARARLALGMAAEVAADLADLLDRHPLRERARTLHMLALYRSGRQTDALASYEEARARLDEELGLVPGPDLANLHRAILLQDPELDGPAPATAAAAPRPAGNLPSAVTGLVGREDAVAELRALLERSRLLTLTGSGGVGKTRLAVEVAGPPGGPFPDGAWLVELGALDRPPTPGKALDALADTVMAVLDVRDVAAPHESPTPAQRLARAVRARRLLLVLDNCEHVIEDVAELTAILLRSAPGLRVLATSREPLGLPGEVVWPVPPLEAPEPAHHNDPAELERFSAVRLFVARAAAAARGFALTPANAEAVAVLCRRLDGIPLALELAATRVRALGMRGLMAGLDDRFRLLATGHRGAPPRQQTLMAMIDWSWQLLTPSEQVVLRRLAVHADGCTAEGAEAVCSGDGVAAEEVRDVLARLVDRSLVVVAERDDDGPRYRLLESVAAYCLDRMREADELRRVRRRHGLHYAELAERAEPHLYGPEQRRWLRRLDAEAANLRGALDAAARDGAADLALRLAGALTWYWFLRGRLAEARRSLQAALDAGGEAAPALRARVGAWETGIAFLLGDTADWPDRHDAALRPYERVDDPRGRARAQWFLAYAEIDLGDVDATGRRIDQAADAFRALGDAWGEAAALALRAKHAHIRGDQAALERDGARSEALFRRLGDRWGLLQATEWLGAHAGLTGDHERAVRLHRDGLRMAEELELWPDVAGRLSWLGWIAMQSGDHARARDYCREGLRLATEQGSPLGAVFAEMGLAFAARREGDLDAAEIHLRTLMDAAERQDAGPGRPLYLPSVLVELGYVEELRGNAAAALARHAEAFGVARELGAVGDVAQALSGLAAAVALDGRPRHAALLLGAAAGVRASAGIAISPAERGDTERATAAARAALGDDAFAEALARGRELEPGEARSLLDRAEVA
ncbi:SARP family transcriptional regulator [Microbispora corallina]|uniref:SARP family transcriptional regulator n=1 Tax=Microbispora corallina TaxID=83302 RepID=A0ABQ4G7J1_9ACTN|nr:BTAD domain-containing putative transcriptional regulator [Microbispora corallina]GIH42999.1 SARP family transcriptional regulator [Microbispora corallina]